MKKVKTNHIPGVDKLIQEQLETDLSSSAMAASKKVERVVISDDVTLRLNAWIKQVQSSRPGVEISRRDLVEWLILRRSDELLPSEVKELAEANYNELRFLQFAVRELKAARARGEKIILQDVIGALPLTSRSKDRSARNLRVKKTSGDEPSPQPALSASDVSLNTDASDSSAQGVI